MKTTPRSLRVPNKCLELLSGNSNLEEFRRLLIRMEKEKLSFKQLNFLLNSERKVQNKLLIYQKTSEYIEMLQRVGFYKEVKNENS